MTRLPTVRPERSAEQREARSRRAARLALAALFAAATTAAAAPANAAPSATATRVAGPGQQVADRLARGERMFAEQEYDAAIKTLLPVTRDRAASRAQRVRAWEVIALARFISRDEAGAHDAFERVLEIDPGFQLRDASGSPRIRAFFDRVRREVSPGAASDVDLEHAAPSGATAGARVELEVRVTRGAARVREVVVAHRALGALTYRETPGRAGPADTWRVALTLPPARAAGTLEYYVVARGAEADGEVARIAAPDQPLTLAVAPGGAVAARRPWYGRWYVIAGVAVVAAGATGAIIAGSGGPADGSLPPGTVTVTP